MRRVLAKPNKPTFKFQIKFPPSKDSRAVFLFPLAAARDAYDRLFSSSFGSAAAALHAAVSLPIADFTMRDGRGRGGKAVRHCCFLNGF